MRAATYARVSTQEQADTGTSLDTQRDRTRAYVDAQGWELVAEYVDEGVSGAADRRPDLDRLMGECRDGNVDVIVVAKLDRFTRSSRHLANAMAELEDLGVGFASLAESVDSTTASGRMFRTLLGAFAEFERERITERMMEGHRRIIEAGGWTGGPPPFGYRAVSSGTMKKLALDDGGEAETVRLAVSMVVDQGCSAYEAAKRLNALGKGPRRAARWSHQNLRRVLLDETIAGRWKWGKQSDRVETVTVPIPPIIDVDRFDDLQRVLALTATGPQERRRDYPLTGRVNSVCGSTFTGVWRKDRLRRYYRCRNNKPPYSGEATGPCGCRSLVADDIETVVWETIVNVLSEPDRLLALAAEYLGERASQVPIERSQNDEIERKIADLETAAGERVADGLKAGIDPKLLKAAADTINQELDSLRRHRPARHVGQGLCGPVGPDAEAVESRADRPSASRNSEHPRT